jgi:hypothetical protein
MKAFAAMIVVGSALLAGCARKALQQDGGSGGIGRIDGGQGLPSGRDADDLPAWPDSGTTDTATGFAGIRSFVVTSQLQHNITGGPTSHVFTMVLDGDQQTAILGAGGLGHVMEFSSQPGGRHRISGVQFNVEGRTCPAGSEITYRDIQFTINGNGLSGSGSGQMILVSGSGSIGSDVTMSLSGVADKEGPTVKLVSGTNNPLGSLSLAASEPLPAAANLALRAADGETIPLLTVGEAGRFVSAFEKPLVILRYATQYQIIASGLADFAGNPSVTTTALGFTTVPRPPLAAEDGFESVTDAYYGGARLLSGAGEPTIGGAKSIYVPVYNPVTTTLPLSLALRLPVSPGDTVVRFSYRAVNGNTPGVTYTLGSEGRMSTTPAFLNELVTLTPATIAGSQVTLGPLSTASFPLPPDVTNEVVFGRTVQAWFGCGQPPPTVGGIIIDDLRVE